jgi:hypothetical protein
VKIVTKTLWKEFLISESAPISRIKETTENYRKMPKKPSIVCLKKVLSGQKTLKSLKRKAGT